MSAKTLETLNTQLGKTATEMVQELGTKSAVIRKLAADGMSRGDISRYMEIRYQHVRNVLTQPLKKQQ